MTCTTIALCVLISGWLDGHSYDPPHRDAVLSYIGRESGFEADRIGHTGACLYQWAGERRRAVLAVGSGRCPDWRTQVEFADAELRGVFAGFWRSASPVAYMREYFGRGRVER